MSWEICALHPESDVTEGVALAKQIHGIKDGFGMGISHYIFRGHSVLTSTCGSQTTQGV